MNLKEIREMSTTDLRAEVESLKKELFTLRFKQASGDLANGYKMREVRKTIARILTVITERENVKA